MIRADAWQLAVMVLVPLGLWQLAVMVLVPLGLLLLAIACDLRDRRCAPRWYRACRVPLARVREVAGIIVHILDGTCGPHRTERLQIDPRRR